jgi:arylsulfatase A-like enzyme
LSWPAGGVRQDATCDNPVNHCDLWATVLEVAGATPGEDTARRINSPGRSYLAQLRGQSSEGWRETIFFEYGNARMARTGRYKLIERHPYQGVRFPDELYDLEQDPRETVNRYDDAALQFIVRDLSAELRRFFATYTVSGHSGLDLEHQPECTPHSPWIAAAKEQRGG